MPLPEGVVCRTRPRKDGSKYTKCYGGLAEAKDEKKKTQKKSNTNNIAMMESEKKPSRRKQSAPKRNAKTIPQQIARKELIRGRSYQADRARAELVGKPMPPAPKPGKVALKRNIRAKAKGDVRLSAPAKAPAKAPAPAKGGGGGKVEDLIKLANEKKPTGDYSFKKDDPQVFLTAKEDIITGTGGKGMKAGGRFKVKAVATRGKGERYIVLRPDDKSMTMGNIAKSNKFGELLMSMKKFKEVKNKMTIN